MLKSAKKIKFKIVLILETIQQSMVAHVNIVHWNACIWYLEVNFQTVRMTMTKKLLGASTVGV